MSESQGVSSASEVWSLEKVMYTFGLLLMHLLNNTDFSALTNLTILIISLKRWFYYPYFTD